MQRKRQMQEKTQGKKEKKTINHAQFQKRRRKRTKKERRDHSPNVREAKSV